MTGGFCINLLITKRNSLISLNPLKPANLANFANFANSGKTNFFTHFKT